MGKDNLIFIHKLLKAIADSIIIVFIPLYVLKQTGDINLALAYLIIYTAFVLFFMFVLKKVLQKYGVIAIMLHFIPIIATEAVLSFVSIDIWTIVLCAAFMGLAQALYSIPLNLVFTFGDKKTNVGKFQIATNVGKLLFTLVSGLILSENIENSFLFLSIASSVFYIACVFPIGFAYKELKENYKAANITNTEKIKVDKWFIIYHMSFGIFQPIMDNIVPLYLFMNSLDFKAVTIVIVIVDFLKIAMNHISQKLVNHKKSLICVIISSIVFVVSSVCILLVKNNIALYVFSCTCSISFPLTFVPMFRMYCNYVKDTNNVFTGITNRDFDIFSGRPVMYALGYVGLGLLPCFICGIAAIPLMLISEIKLINKYEKGE